MIWPSPKLGSQWLTEVRSLGHQWFLNSIYMGPMPFYHRKCLGLRSGTVTFQNIPVYDGICQFFLYKSKRMILPPSK